MMSTILGIAFRPRTLTPEALVSPFGKETSLVTLDGVMGGPLTAPGSSSSAIQPARLADKQLEFGDVGSPFG